MGVLTEAVDDVLSTQLRRAFGFDAFLVSLGMVGVVVGALALVGAMTARQVLPPPPPPCTRHVLLPLVTPATRFSPS